MTTLNLTDRQITIISIAITNLYDEIAKSGEGGAMRDDIMELSKYIQQLEEQLKQQSTQTAVPQPVTLPPTQSQVQQVPQATQLPPPPPVPPEQVSQSTP